MLRKLVLCVGMLVAAANAGRADPVLSFNQIDTWVGTGANSAAFVVDWNNGVATESYVWGYRWDGTATGEDMFRALAGANVGLYGSVTYFSSFGQNVVLGYGLDANRDGQFGVTPPLTFVNGVATQQDNAQGANDGRTAATPGDFYREGYNQGYWSYWVSNESGTSPANPYADGTNSGWVSSNSGFSDRTLQNGSWDGWSFAPAFAATMPGVPSNAPGVVPTPEPATLGLVAAGGLGLVGLWKRRQGRAA